MANFYKKIRKISFRGNIPMINDMDEALHDPYKKPRRDILGPDMMTPGDRGTSQLGVDFMDDRKPPKDISIEKGWATRPKWHDSFDGTDPERNDKRPPMKGPSKFYDPTSPLSDARETARALDRPDRDNSAIGPHNQFSIGKTYQIYDNVRRRLS